MSLLRGFGLRWYRSFHGDIQLVAPMSRVTLLAGQNNAGKSNVLRFANEWLRQANQSATRLRFSPPQHDSLDVPQNRGIDDVGVELAIAYGTVDEVVAKLQESKALHSQVPDALRQVFTSAAFRLDPQTGFVWFRYALASTQVGGSQLRLRPLPAQIDACLADESIDQQAKGLVSTAASNLTSNSGAPADDLRRVIEKLNALTLIPPVAAVNAFRQVRVLADGESHEDEYSGEALINKLARLQEPDMPNLSDRERFESINRFVRTVLEDNSATLRIPFSRTTILVERDGTTLPLTNLGTGIEEVIILAAAATLRQETLVCIEEPEIHLHPVLQRKLLRYLATETNNQYLIATHSAHMLDSELASIFHVTLGSDGTEIRHATLPKDRAAICADLGYRPSDLVQANAVIWVEGPSDRIYIRHWLSLIDPTLIEGIHYSLMFYGGRLLNHLSANDPDVEEFISLRRLNRHIAIVIDSDKTSAQGRINSTKKRVRDEFSEGPGFSWITKGYTIENYIPQELLQRAVIARHPKAKFEWNGGLYINPLTGPAFGTTGPDKVAISRTVVEMWDKSTEWPSDLLSQVRKCSNFVRVANGLVGRSE